MASIIIVGDARPSSAWESVLQEEGHTVETCESAVGFQERFSGDAPDVFIVDVTQADCGEAMLIAQARAAWYECKIIAIASSYAFRSSAIFKMGLWQPDQLLIKPVSPRVLAATVAYLWAQTRTERIRRLIPRTRPFGPIEHGAIELSRRE